MLWIIDRAAYCSRCLGHSDVLERLLKDLDRQRREEIGMRTALETHALIDMIVCGWCGLQRCEAIDVMLGQVPQRLD